MGSDLAFNSFVSGGIILQNITYYPNHLTAMSPRWRPSWVCAWFVLVATSWNSSKSGCDSLVCCLKCFLLFPVCDPGPGLIDELSSSSLGRDVLACGFILGSVWAETLYSAAGDGA
jgi:hypothetical protein